MGKPQRKAICTGNVGLCHHFHSSHQKQEEASGSHPACLQEQNICRFCNQTCPPLSLLRRRVSLPSWSPPSPKRGRQSHCGCLSMKKTRKECVPAPVREAWLETGTGGGLVAKSCPTLCDPVGYGLPGSSVHGIFWARILQ